MAQLTPIRGFSNTPISKAICIVSTLVALGLSIFQMKHYVRLSIDPYILEYEQYWRVLTYEMAVINESDYMLCVLLWFQYKNLERFYGSRKYVSLIVVFALYNSIVCFLVMGLGQLGVNYAVYLVSLITSGGMGTLNIVQPCSTRWHWAHWAFCRRCTFATGQTYLHRISLKYCYRSLRYWTMGRCIHLIQARN